MYSRMSRSLPCGSTPLLRVNPQDYEGHDIVPVCIGRKAPSVWSRAEFAADGMFAHGDTMVWIYDLELVSPSAVPSGAMDQPMFSVPDEFSGDETRAVPLSSLAGVGQGLKQYMARMPDQADGAPTKLYRLRPGVTSAARLNLVLMSTNPQAAFPVAQTAHLSGKDIRRAPLRPNLFPKGTRIRQGFEAPVVGNRRSWKGKRKLDATVVEILLLLQTAAIVTSWSGAVTGKP
ncbi:unnamed protein product [Ectocarpus sp. 8 AP-2014]